MSRLPFVFALLAPALALGQVPAPPPPPTATAPVAASGARPPFAQAVDVPVAPPLNRSAPKKIVGTVAAQPAAPNYDSFSLFDAATLETGQVAFTLAVGFPYAMVRGGYGVVDALDVGAGFNSLYGQVNQPYVWGKYRLKGDKQSGYALAARLDAELTFFRAQPASGETTRWLTGQRDFSLHPGLQFSTRTNKGLVFFVDAGVQVTFDTHPVAGGPLTGPKPAMTLGANLPLRMGVDLPLSKHASFFGAWGLDFHFRKADSTAMPYLEVGATFGG